MASITGPLHSDDASGKFAGSIVYSKWKGRNYARQLVTPSNPKSAAQVGIRVMMKWLSQIWSSLSAPDKATWDTLAEASQVSSFNAMVGNNLARWQANAGPTQAYPAAETNDDLLPDDVGVDGELLSTTGHDGFASGGATPDSTGAADAIAAILFRGAAAPTPLSWATAIQILAVTPGAAWTFTDSPLDAGTYHYKIAYFSDDGAIGALSAADNEAVVT